MQFWNDFLTWLNDNMALVFQTLVVVGAVLITGLLTAWTSASALKRLVRQRDDESRRAVVAALVDAATEASVWNSLTPQEQVMADRAVGQADILTRMLPVPGADIAAKWAAHRLFELKRNSATFGYQLEPAVADFRDRMVNWLRHPSRARRQFQQDLIRWEQRRLATPETPTIDAQDAWIAQQHHQRYAPTEVLERTE
ncbi:MAG TPA: hypothetical protein VFU07_08105 [Candidatus Lumbricidophila sp.]|nr:hypothetical protein [Candidatus Lumbricidophila sp.]